ncbi:MAG TPA: hypothetical protein VF049_13045 [Nocardioidaceae bacterium]
MSATAITPSTRYFLPGTTKVIVVPTIANLATGPTRAELDAGTDVSEEVATINGWRITSENVATPDLGKRFNKQVTGRLSADDSSITFWADLTGQDVRETLTLDLETHVVFLDGGDVPASPMDAYKVKVGSVGKVREIEGAGRLDIQFSIRDYAENLAVPAAV